MKLRISNSLLFLCCFPVLQRLWVLWHPSSSVTHLFSQTTFSPSPMPAGLFLFINIFKLNLFHLAAHPLGSSLRIFYGHVYCYSPLFVFASGCCGWHKANCICMWTGTGFHSHGAAVTDVDCPQGGQRLAG